MQHRKMVFSLLMLWPVFAVAQLTYSIDQSIPVEKNGEALALAWAGGLNSAQINTIDINGDSKQDLVIFDRAGNKVITYLNINNHYRYAPEYESLFPAEVGQWMLLRDFNCDGKKDIFTSDIFGVRVFQNVTAPGQALEWKDLDILRTDGLSGDINVKVNQSDIPAIDDVDGDGDLDVLNLQSASTNGMVEYHKNMSVENTGTCGAMQLKLITKSWGNFTECECGKFALDGQPCSSLPGGRTQHVGGKAIVTIDLDNNGVRDLLFVEESCSNLYLLTNNGTKDDAHIAGSTVFPATSPINFQIFPAAYLEDVDFDGLPDLVASPNTYVRSSFNENFRQSVMLYKNTGTTSLPSFTFVKNDFLQDEMIDVGDYAVPAFTDIDRDGDLDMFIGAYSTQTYRGSIYQFENVGTLSSPSFRYVTDDFLGLRALMNQYAVPPWYNIKPQFTDMNADGETDLAFTATNAENGTTRLHYIPSTNNGVDFSAWQFISINIAIGAAENLYITDVNQDGAKDLLIGKSTGALQYWKNLGAPGFYNLTLNNGAYLGLGSSISRQSLSVYSSDLDADGKEDLVTGDQYGKLSVYKNFRAFDTAEQPATGFIYNSISKTYESKNLGARIWPTVANLFNTDKPALVVGTTLGGLIVLKNDGGQQLFEEPQLTISPNPLPKGDPLSIRSDRDVLLQVFSIMGQKMSEPVPVPAHQDFSLPINVVAPGMYIARFTTNGKSYNRKFIIY
jgi:hypothetical protein